MPEPAGHIRDRTSLDGRVAVVTGAARGMGAEQARSLAARGAAVVLADVDAEGGRALAAELEEYGSGTAFVRADVRDPAHWEIIRETALDRFGGVHVLVNNAGVVGHRRIGKITRAEWQRVMDINLKGAFLGMKTLAPDIRDAGGGSIVNVSSAAGLDQHPDPSYTASKWGLRGLTKTAAQELGPWRIRVNSIHPGYMDTPMNDFASPALRAAKVSLLPLGRPGEAWEAGELVAFLASDAAAFITGAEIAIDGGWTSGAQATEARRTR
ncbi:SDR family NAD(P)-dependent oxidoreductase [Actinomadura viridis]|uniref:SDR family NAD(P)-dependent oxidoreductase n=1 Tax=Actinomadura viridis TaxID=58110 RepID=UPI0036CCB67A